jgi:hypothetical protein
MYFCITNSIKFFSSRSFQQHQKGTFQFLRNFQLRFNLIFKEEIIQYSRTFAHKSKCHRTKPMHLPPPFPSIAFQRHQEHNLKHPSFPKTPRTQSEAFEFRGSHKYKQNKQPSFIDRQSESYEQQCTK